MGNKKKITIILPVYNGGLYLKESVSSVLNQTTKNFDFLIVDDCSDDGSYEWLCQLNDERVTLFRNTTNKGLFYNLNFLIKHSNTSLIKLWAQDDVMKPECLETFIDFYDSNSNVGFIYCAVEQIDEYGRVNNDSFVDKTPEIISTKLHTRIAYYTGSIAGNIANVCITKNGINKVGLFDEGMIISGDFDMWVRLAEHFHTGFINKKLIQLRVHNDQLSKRKKYLVNHGIEDFIVFRKLDLYTSIEERRIGRKLMHINKLISYYTIILKFLSEGDFKNGWRLYRTVAHYTNFTKLSVIFISRKLGLIKKPVFKMTEDILISSNGG